MSNSELGEAKSILDQGDFKTALMLYQKIISTEPQTAIAYQYASVALANLGNYPDALSMSIKALQLDPTLVIPHTTIAIVYNELGEKEKSRKEAKIALEKDPESPEALCCSGILSLVDNNLDDALKYLEKAVQINPSFYLAQYNLATVYQRKYDPRKLLRQTVILFRLRPNIKSLFRLMYILSRLYKFAHFPILLLTVFVALMTEVEVILAVTFFLTFVWFAGGIYIGLMAEKKHSNQLLINMMAGSGVASLGILLYFWMKGLFGV